MLTHVKTKFPRARSQLQIGVVPKRGASWLRRSPSRNIGKLQQVAPSGGKKGELYACDLSGQDLAANREQSVACKAGRSEDNHENSRRQFTFTS